ncbi:acyltransferase family protein [Sphaerisporangium sp. NPDC005288]|uniref:acyltransferase family protein n=1 Tax=Sphaerisporangium sp. NPDC005288 TaxID=3155114 RepID=UPI0033AA73E2
MSDTRSSFQVPASRTDGVSTDAGDGAPSPERGQAPADPGLSTGAGIGAGTDAGTGEEEAPTARWPVPDYAEPPTGAWDRHRPPTGDRRREPRWPVPDSAMTAGDGTGRGRRGAHSGGTPADDDPETFTFDRPSWEDNPGAHGSPAAPGANGGSMFSGSHDAVTSSGAHGIGMAASPGPGAHSEATSSGGHALGSVPGAYGADPGVQGSLPGPHGGPGAHGSVPGARDALGVPVEAPESAPSPDGFSYWQRPAAPQPGGGATPPGRPGPGSAMPARERRPSGEGPGQAVDGWDDPETEEAPPPRPAKRPREPYLDNVKFLLIALVPAGHALVPTLSAHSSRSAYLFIYVFHMPLFVVISGYLSRNFWNSNAKTNKLVDTFLVPYVIVEVGYAVLRFALGHKWSLTIIDPAWLNWYLLALLLWRLSTPVWKRMRYPLPIAVAVYLLAGLSDLPGDFSMDRFFGLMPFFVLGLWLQPHHFDMLNRLWVKIVSVGVLAGAVGVAIVIAPHVPLDPVYFKDSYAELHLSWWMGMGMRAGLLVAALAVSFAILALVPRKNTWFSDLGTRTLYCYLLHGIPVMIAKEMGWLSFPWLHGPLGVMAILSSAFALAIVLCLPETRTVFKWLLEPRLTWLYRRPSNRPKEATT